jgi:REP element-mobilizing transposase RayT
MTRPLRLEYPGALWHVYNRGVEQRDIFVDDDDRQLFLDLLIGAIAEYQWLLHAWVEMTNHFHLLIETPRTTLSHGMQAFTGGYATEFNMRHGRVGHLFQGRFGSELVEEDTYLLNHSKAQRFGIAPSLEAIRSVIEAECGVAVSVKSWRSQRARAAFALLARRVAAAPWPVIGKQLTMSETGADMRQWTKKRPGTPYEPEIVEKRSGKTSDPDGTEVRLRGFQRKHAITTTIIRRGLARRARYLGTPISCVRRNPPLERGRAATSQDID